MNPFETIGKLLPKETIGKAYEDALSGPAQQLGKFGTDALKTARLILAPLQIAAAFQDRLEKMCERISKRVPEERRVEAPPEIAGPALERLKYTLENSELADMFEEILTKSVDSEAQAKIHPSFGHIIAQLSRDEAWMLFRLRDRDFKVTDHLEFDQIANRFHNRVVEKSDLPKEELFQPDLIELSYSHLESLSLVTWPVLTQEPLHASTAGVQTGVRRHSRLMLTDFGKLFVAACIPADGFEKHAKPE